MPSSRAKLACVGIFCALSAQACTLDERKLSRRADSAETDGQADSSYGGQGTNVHTLDSGPIDYSSHDAAEHDSGKPGPVHEGPCAHVDELGKPDCDKTLVSNADFNKDIVGWNPEAGGELRWVDFDAQEAKTSGSIAVLNAQHGDVDGTVGVAASQCLPAVMAKETYAFAANVYIKRGQSYGQGQILVFLYQESGCKGLIQGAYAVTGVQSTERWLNATGTSVTIPEGVKSMGVRLHVEKPFRSDTLEVLYDAVRVTKLP